MDGSDLDDRSIRIRAARMQLVLEIPEAAGRVKLFVVVSTLGKQSLARGVAQAHHMREKPVERREGACR
jgi:hypothetical protein